jgi:sec-independent protein translocase protein TatB
MCGIGSWELVLILFLGLIVLGPKQLAQVAKTLGRTLARLRRTAEEVKREINLDGIKREFLDDQDVSEIRQAVDVRQEIRKTISDLELPAKSLVPPHLDLAALPAPEATSKSQPNAEEKPAQETKTPLPGNTKTP